MLAVSAACRPSGSNARVKAQYDRATGRLSQLIVNNGADSNPNIISYMEGTKFVRIEIDSNEDGKTDRWEYYGPSQTVERIGISRANDGIQDTWLVQSADGSLARIEISTRRNGKANRTEFYENDVLARAEEDTDADGRVDKWEKYEAGALVSASFDTTKSGKPTATIYYGK